MASPLFSRRESLATFANNHLARHVAVWIPLPGLQATLPETELHKSMPPDVGVRRGRPQR